MRQDLVDIAGDIMAALESLRPAFEWPPDGEEHADGSEAANMDDSRAPPRHACADGALASAPAPVLG